ncbi:MAG: SPOR domain-containing protein [Gammaproteobacteria bacterium]
MLPYLVSPSLRQRLDLVAHLLAFGRQLVVISGAPGSGRSRLLAALAAGAADDTSLEVVTLDGRACGARAALLVALYEALKPADGVTDGDDAALVDAIRVLVRQRRARQRQPVVMIDDADGLDDSAVAVLLDLAHRGDALDELRVVLAAQADSALVSRLEEASGHAAQVHVVSVPLLDAARLVELGEAWCEERGLPEDVLPTTVLEEIAQASAGNPGRFLAALGARLDAGTTGAGGWHIAVPPALRRLGGIAVVVLAALGLIALALYERDAGDDAPATTGETTIELRLPPAPGALTGSAGPAQSDGSATASAVPAEPMGSELAAAATGAGARPGPEARPEAGPEAGPDAQASAATGAPAQAATATPPAVPRAPREVAPAAPPATPVQVVPPAGSQEKSEYSEKWVLTHADHYYVIQLFGARTRAAAEAFRRRHALAARSAVLERSHEGAPWYVLIAGLYPDRAAAARAVARLPAAQRSAGAWPRTVASLRK